MGKVSAHGACSDMPVVVDHLQLPTEASVLYSSMIHRTISPFFATAAKPPKTRGHKIHFGVLLGWRSSVANNSARILMEKA